MAAKVKALYLKAENGQGAERLPVDSEIEVVHRDSSFVVARGRFLRFKSGDEWLLVSPDSVGGLIYDDKP